MNIRRVFFLGGLMALAGSTFSGTASARTMTAWGAFRAWPSYGAQDCVQESWGAAISSCSAAQTMLFEMPVDNWDTHNILAWSAGTGYGSFTCQAQSIQPQGLGWGYWGAQSTFNPSGQQALTFSVYVGGGYSLRLDCWNVSNGRGLASLDVDNT